MSFEIDLNAINAEIEASIAAKTPQEIEAELLALRVKQKVAQKKYQSPERQKTYQAKQKAMKSALKKRALELGIYDAVNTRAGELADAQLAAEELASEPENE
jgi:hypothetical protein